MPAGLRKKIEGKKAIHSARAGYSPDGYFGNQEQEADRSMRIIVSEEARDTQRHPIIRSHPETGVEGLFGCFGYIIGIEGMSDDESRDLLMEVYNWQTRDEFIYRHSWQKDMLVMWDNRSVLHKANGGYDGYDRLLHRITIAEQTSA
jgi:taurine dioxygenase